MLIIPLLVGSVEPFKEFPHPIIFLEWTPKMAKDTAAAFRDLNGSDIIKDLDLPAVIWDIA